jgi:hypothetical protein
MRGADRVESGRGAFLSEQERSVNIRLLIFPELGRSILADGIDETIGMDHSNPFVYG